jgi:hypothetical protein
MKNFKFISKTLIIFNSIFLFSGNIKADEIPCPLPAELCDARSAINALSSLILPAAALILLIVLIYAGFTKLTAAGNADQEKKAMEIIKAAIIGFAIIALAGVIVATLGSFFGVQLLPSSD